MNKYDITIIGSGPGGYVAAIKASQLGKKVALIEENELGGVCCNWGCIPTKALLKNAEVLDLVKNASKYGIEISDFSINWSKVISRSRDISSRLNKGIQYLMKKNKISIINGRGIIKDKNTVLVSDFDGKKQEVKTDYIIISTGAKPKYFKGMEPDGKQIITSKEAMSLEKQPKSLIVVGGGAIGVEFAHFYSTFGTSVTLVEGMPNILPVEDQEISKELERLFKKRKIKILTDTFVENIEKLKTKCKVTTNKGEVLEAQKVILAVGVSGNSENIGLEENGIKCKNSWISVNGFMQTNLSNIYAIGDVAGPPWLAHVASEEGIVAVEHICGLRTNQVSYDNIPGCTYCHPEIASIGFTEKEAIDKGYDVKVGKFSFRALGKSLASSDVDGFVKIIFDKKYGELLGCHIIGAEATNLISEIGIARKLETTWHEILETVHPHPTLSEAIVEATADALGHAIHI